MAAPPNLTIKDISGPWVLNKTISDDPDAALALQGISWIKRKAIAWATITLAVKQYTSDDGLTHIDIDQTATGGIKGTTEIRILDWVERPHYDDTFGDCQGRSEWVDPTSGEKWNTLDGYMTEGWEAQDSEKGGPAGERHVHSFVRNESAGWTAEQIWGFVIIEGARYYARRIVVTKGEQKERIRLVYDWQGKA